MVRYCVLVILASVALVDAGDMDQDRNRWWLPRRGQPKDVDGDWAKPWWRGSDGSRRGPGGRDWDFPGKRDRTGDREGWGKKDEDDWGRQDPWDMDGPGDWGRNDRWDSRAPWWKKMRPRPRPPPPPPPGMKPDLPVCRITGKNGTVLQQNRCFFSQCNITVSGVCKGRHWVNITYCSPPPIPTLWDACRVEDMYRPGKVTYNKRCDCSLGPVQVSFNGTSVKVYYCQKYHKDKQQEGRGEEWRRDGDSSWAEPEPEDHWSDEGAHGGTKKFDADTCRPLKPRYPPYPPPGWRNIYPPPPPYGDRFPRPPPQNGDWYPPPRPPPYGDRYPPFPFDRFPPPRPYGDRYPPPPPYGDRYPPPPSYDDKFPFPHYGHKRFPPPQGGDYFPRYPPPPPYGNFGNRFFPGPPPYSNRPFPPPFRYGDRRFPPPPFSTRERPFPPPPPQQGSRRFLPPFPSREDEFPSQFEQKEYHG